MSANPADKGQPANDACLVRRAVDSDHELLQIILDEASGHSGAMIHGDDAKALLAAHEVFIAFVDDDAVGCVMCSRQPGTLIIHNLAVTMRHRNRGHATTLVKTMISIMDGDGPLHTCWAAVDPANPSAARRFHRLGFHPFNDGARLGYNLMFRTAGSRQSNDSGQRASWRGRIRPVAGSSGRGGPPTALND